MRVQALKLCDEAYGTEWVDRIENRWLYAGDNAPPRRSGCLWECALPT